MNTGEVQICGVTTRLRAPRGNTAVPPTAGGDVPPGAVRVPRTVGAVSGTAIIVGTMIGSGIFVSPAGVLHDSGSVALSLLVWLGCGVLSTLGALCYIELGLLIPESGAEYAYLFHGMGPLHRFLGPLPAFLQAWTISLITMPASTAILSLAFAEYCVQPWYGSVCAPPPLVVPLVAILTCCLVTAINCYSVTMTTHVQNATTLSKLVAIGVIVAGGAYSLARGNVQHLATGFQGSTTSPSAIATAFYSGLWAYDGWNNLNYLTEEVVNPERNLPLAILVALALVTVCYLLTNIAYLAVLSPHELLASPAVAASFATRALGPAAFLVPLGVALSVCGALNGTVIASGRACFASARRGHQLHVLSFMHLRYLTPTPALLFNAAVSIVLIAVGSIGGLINFFSFTRWMFYGLTMVALLVLRRTQPDAVRPYRVSLPVPWLVIIICCYLVVVPVVEAPQFEFLYVLAFLLVGVLVYTVLVFYRLALPGMAEATACCQKALELVPAA